MPEQNHPNHHDEVPVSYWLNVANALQGVQELFSASTRDECFQIVDRYPILALPEMPDAIIAFISNHPDENAKKFGYSRAKTLKTIQQAIRENDRHAQAKLLGKCGILLAQEQQGKLSVNTQRAIEIFQEARTFCEPTSEDFAHCLLNEGNARTTLTKLSIDAQANAEKAIALYQQAREIYPRNSSSFATSLRNEGSTRQDLARLNIDTRANLEKAIALNRQARSLLAANSIETARNFLDEGNAHSMLGTENVAPETNFQAAIALYKSARDIYPANNQEYGLCLLNEAKARLNLAKNLEIDVVNNANKAVELCTDAYQFFASENMVQLSSALSCEAEARTLLAKKAVDAKPNLETAIQLCSLARSIIQEEAEIALILSKEAEAHTLLSDLSPDPEEHLRAAMNLYEAAIDLWPAGSENLFASVLHYDSVCTSLANLDKENVADIEKVLALYDRALAASAPNGSKYARILYNKGAAYWRLAMKNVAEAENLQQALDLFGKAAEVFVAGSSDQGRALQSMGRAHSKLADIEDEKSHLEQALECYRKAKACFDPVTEEFAESLSNEAMTLQELAYLRVHTAEDIETAIRMYQQARERYAAGTENYALSLFSEANARARLADIGVEPVNNLNGAIKLYQQARQQVSPKEETFSKCLINEALALQDLADLGIDAKLNLEKKLQLLDEAVKKFPIGSRDYADILMNRATAFVRYADLGVYVQKHLEDAISLYGEARKSYPPTSSSFARSLQNEGNARKELAGFGVAAQANTEQAIELYQQARKLVSPTSAQFAQALLNEGIARKQLADLGIEPLANLNESLTVLEQALEIYPPTNISYARAQMNEANTRLAIAALGVETTWNLEQAVSLYHQARQLFLTTSIDAAVCLMYEGNARNELAELDVDKEANLNQAIDLYQRAREIFQPDSLDFARCLMIEGNSRQHLAVIHIDAVSNLEQALQLYIKAHDSFLLLSPEVLSKSPDLASCLINEGGARFNQADLGIDVENNLRRMIELCTEGRQFLQPDSASFAQALANEGAARQRLAEHHLDEEENRKQAAELFRDTGKLFLQLGSYLDAVKSFESLAFVEKELNDLPQTQNAYQQAIAALEKVRTSTLVPQDRRAWMDKHDNLFRGMVKTSLQLKQYEVALDYVERARSRALLEMLYVRDFEPRNYPKEKLEIYREKRERAELLQTTITTASMDGPVGVVTQSDNQRREKSALLNDLRQMEEEMRQSDPDYFALAKPISVADMKQVAAAMRRTLVIVWMESNHTAVFFVRPDESLTCLEVAELGTKRVVEWFIGPEDNRGSTGWMVKYLQSLKNYETAAERESSHQAWIDQIDETTSALYKELLGTIHEWLREWNETRVALVVGGLLSMLPLHAACWREDDKDHYLIETLDIVYAPSVWVLQRCLSRKRDSEVPVMAASTSGKGAPLVFSKWEVQRIRQLLESAKGANTCNAVLDSEATVAFVLENMPKQAISHFSCHGKWNGDDPLTSSLSFYDADLPLSRLLRRVRLENCRLVVLSACESGAGHSYKQVSEEYLGLPAGFIFAGARAVVGSLWSVLDPPTALLMIRLYDNLLDGDEVSAALRKAQIWLMNLNKQDALALLKEVTEVVAPSQVKGILSGIDKWGQTLGPYPFARPYYWGAFQALGSPEAVFNGQRN